MACFICKDVKTKDVFNCDGCNNCICKGCGGLTASEVKVLQLVSGRTLKFYCPNCIKGDSFDLYKELVTCKEQIIEDKNEIIKLLKKDIEDVIVKDPMSGAKMGYNEVLKSNKKEEVILIKPKNTEQTSSLTRRKLEETVNPCTLGATVSKVKNVRQGGVAIKCSNQEEIKTICENVQKQIGTDYEVKVPEKKNPRIEVFNVGQKLSENKDELIEKMVIQNCITTEIEKRELKIVNIFKNRKGMINVIMQLDPETYANVKKREVLNLGWKTCYYRDYVNIIQCFKCWRFGHQAKYCKNTCDICPKCSGKHKSDDCTANQHTCVNCKYASEILKIPNINYDHPAYNRECAAYRRIVIEVQERTDYQEWKDQKREEDVTGDSRQ